MNRFSFYLDNYTSIMCVSDLAMFVIMFFTFTAAARQKRHYENSIRKLEDIILEKDEKLRDLLEQNARLQLQLKEPAKPAPRSAPKKNTTKN